MIVNKACKINYVFRIAICGVEGGENIEKNSERSRYIYSSVWHVLRDCERMYLEYCKGMIITEQNINNALPAKTTDNNGVFGTYKTSVFSNLSFCGRWWSSSALGVNLFNRAP